MAKQHIIQYVNFYTDGSAARKIEPVQPVAKPVTPKRNKKRSKVIRLDPIAILGMTVAACMLIMMIVGLCSLSKAEDETLAMQQYVNKLSQEKLALENQFEQRCDLDQIQQTALALGMVPADQVQQTTIYLQPDTQQESENTSVWVIVGTLLAEALS